MIIYKTQNCLKFIKKSLHVDGDLIELGVYKGNNLLAIAKYLKNNDIYKTIYACDTFSGMPESDKKIIANPVQKGEFSSSYDFLFKKILIENLEQYIVSLVGDIRETLPLYLTDKKFSFAWLDLDIYQSTLFGFKFLENKINKGGIIGFHDYGFSRCPGVKEVVDGINPLTFRKLFNKNYCIFFEKL